MIPAKDLSQEPPRSPRIRLRGYAIMARTIDKCRAEINGTIGDFHFNCPLDNMLFSFKEVQAEDFKKAVETADEDDDVARWVELAGASKGPHEIEAWSDEMEQVSLAQHPEKGEWFREECRRVGLDPSTATLFDYLEADDAASFKK